MDRPDRAGLGARTERDADLATLTDLVGLALPDGDDEPLVGLRDVGDIESNEFAPPHRTGKPEEDEGPVPHSERGCRKIRNHEPDVLCQRRLLVILCDSLLATDALP